MKKPPIQQPSQKNYVQTAVRLPPELMQTIKESAERNARSTNAEIVHRLQDNPMEAVLAELAELKQMVRKLLDQT